MLWRYALLDNILFKQHFATAKKKGVYNMEITKGLLIHWWHHYGKFIYTLDELEEYEKVIDEYGKEKVLDAAIVSCICGDGSPTNILMSIRTDTVKELFESLPDVSTFDEEKKQIYNAMRDEFVRIISKTA